MSYDLTISVIGKVTTSNLESFQAEVAELIASENKILVTDSDFFNAMEMVKSCKKAECAISVAKAKAIVDSGDIAKLFSEIDGISGELRGLRLNLTKQIKEEKSRIKDGLIADMMTSALAMVEKSGLPPGAVNVNKAVFSAAVKGLKNLKSMNEALASALACIEEEIFIAGCNAQKVREVVSSCNNVSLFPDIDALVLQPVEVVEYICRARVDALSAQLVKEPMNEDAIEEPMTTCGTTEVTTPPQVDQADSTYVISVLSYCTRNEVVELVKAISVVAGRYPGVTKISVDKAPPSAHT